jgi:hypothetical protein
MSAEPKQIGRDDIERKLRELQVDVDHVGAEVKSYAIAVGAVIAITVVGVAFMLGRRRGRKRSTVVEIRRI